MHEACLIKDHSALSSWAHLVLSYFATRISLIHSLFTLFACSCSLVFLLLEQVVLSWSCLLLYGACRFLQWTQLLSTWKGVILFVAGLTLVTCIMHVFVLFSQSERSSSARAARNRVKKDWGTPNSLLDQLCRHRCDGKKNSQCLCSIGTEIFCVARTVISQPLLVLVWHNCRFVFGTAETSTWTYWTCRLNLPKVTNKEKGVVLFYLDYKRQHFKLHFHCVLS